MEIRNDADGIVSIYQVRSVTESRDMIEDIITFHTMSSVPTTIRLEHVTGYIDTLEIP